VKKVNPRDISKIYRIYGELQNLRKTQETMSPAEVLAELQAMKKLAAKIKNKQYGPALTTAIDEFIAAVESTIDGNPEQAEQHMRKMAAIKREVSGG
jgi:ADP-ribosylglycohydrolase